MSARISAMAFRIDFDHIHKLTLLAISELVHDDGVPSEVRIGSITRLTNLSINETYGCVLALERNGVFSLEYDEKTPMHNIVFSISFAEELL